MKFISIVGSVQTNRVYDPPIRHPAEAQATAEALGAELAKRGFGLTVYAGDYIERDVVRGYVSAAKEKNSIRVRYASHQQGPDGFPEYATHHDLFDPAVDDSDDWEVSFYGSLAKADGMILMGGGHSSLVAGVLALTHRIPIVALKTFGGSGEKIWKTLANNRGLASADEVKVMGRDADPEMIARCVDSLETQAVARRAEMHRQSSFSWSIAAGILVVAWLISLPLGFWLVPEATKANAGPSFGFITLLFLAPMLAGASGATVRMLIPTESSPTTKTLILGMAAGAITGVLYVLNHLVTNPSAYPFLILVFAVCVGFIAGLTFETVFKKLESIELNTNLPKPTTT